MTKDRNRVLIDALERIIGEIQTNEYPPMVIIAAIKICATKALEEYAGPEKSKEEIYDEWFDFGKKITGGGAVPLTERTIKELCLAAMEAYASQFRASAPEVREALELLITDYEGLLNNHYPVSDRASFLGCRDRARKALNQSASAPEVGAKNYSGIQKEQTFLDYIVEARNKFVIKVNKQEWNTQLRMEAENLLIAYDQMRGKLFDESAPAPSVDVEKDDFGPEASNSDGKPVASHSSASGNSIGQEDIKKLVLDEYQKGNVVFSDMDGLKTISLHDFVEQPTEGLLYDLNRNEVVVLTFINDPKWINDYAVAKVITELKRQVDEFKLLTNVPNLERSVARNDGQSDDAGNQTKNFNSKEVGE